MVSIIIPVYNVKDYVVNAINSAINQTYKDIEIILVDDGSSDGSSEICDEYIEKDNRIKVIHKENGGLSSARNAGLDNANGEFVLFLDGDDYLALNAVEYLISIQKKTDADIVQYRYKETDDSYFENIVAGSEEYELITDRKKFFEKLYLYGGEIASSCTKLYKMGLFGRLRFKEGILHEDEYMATRIFSKVQSVAYIPDMLYFYVMRDSSIIRSEFNIKKLDYFFVRKDRIEKLKELGFSDLLDKEYKIYFSSLMNFYCNAASVKNKQACNKILDLIREYMSYGYKPGGRNRLFYYLCKLNPKTVYIYYLLRKHFGHI